MDPEEIWYSVTNNVNFIFWNDGIVSQTYYIMEMLLYEPLGFIFKQIFKGYKYSSPLPSNAFDIFKSRKFNLWNYEF